MTLALDIPEEVVAALGWSPEETRRHLRQEIALALNTRGKLSAGNSAELAGLARLEFERLLCERQVARSYGQEDLEHDLAWARA